MFNVNNKSVLTDCDFIKYKIMSVKTRSFRLSIEHFSRVTCVPLSSVGF